MVALEGDDERRRRLEWADELDRQNAERRRWKEEIHERRLAQLEDAIAAGDIERAEKLRSRLVTIPSEVPLGQERQWEARQERDDARKWVRDAVAERDAAEERLRAVMGQDAAAEERLRAAICDTSAVVDETGRRVSHDQVVRMQVGFALNPPASTTRQISLLRTLGGLIGIMLLLVVAANFACATGAIPVPEPLCFLDELSDGHHVHDGVDIDV